MTADIMEKDHIITQPKNNSVFLIDREGVKFP